MESTSNGIMVDQIKESLSSAETLVKELVDSFVKDMKLTSERLVSTTSECHREQTEVIEVRKSQLPYPAMYLKTVIPTRNFRFTHKSCTTLYHRAKKTYPISSITWP